MSTCRNLIETLPTNSSGFHLFPLLPYELRIEIWRAAFPSHSTKPMLRVSATSILKNDETPEISYIFKVISDTTPIHAISTPEYLAPFLTTCLESRDLYIEHFKLTATLPRNTSFPIYYNPKTTIYVENGLFISPDISVMETFRSIPTTTVILPAFFNQIQNLALPLSHFDEEILDAYELYSPPTTPTTEWYPSRPVDAIPAREHEETYDVPAINMLGSLFSRLTNLKHLIIVLPDSLLLDDVSGASALANTEDVAESMSAVFRFFKRDIYALDGEWEPAEVSVFQRVVRDIEGEDDDARYDSSLA